ncbi:MAG: phosphoribosylformylglycinamidine synthase subunit PurQ [Bacteriovoracaceae bacterium]|nr:phosphoribosylformylglycinamidine synthase subunit PurQ [Bacteriovoracaceae bacterium]
MVAKFLILSGDGINCEKETLAAFRKVGLAGNIIHINELVKNKSCLKEYQGLALPGGFSFGDELGSGQVLALKIKKLLYQEFYEFVDDNKPIIGICNGFQVLIRLGLLPDHRSDRVLGLAHNSTGHFIDQWTDLDVPESTCLWTKGMGSIELPIRHGEGRIVLAKNREFEISSYLKENKLIALTYKTDINGSHEKIAGLTNKTGTILGLMPHPEAFMVKGLRGAGASVRDVQSPGDGNHFFKNIKYIL